MVQSGYYSMLIQYQCSANSCPANKSSADANRVSHCRSVGHVPVLWGYSGCRIGSRKFGKMQALLQVLRLDADLSPNVVPAGLSAVPRGAWYCALCEAKRKGLTLKWERI